MGKANLGLMVLALVLADWCQPKPQRLLSPDNYTGTYSKRSKEQRASHLSNETADSKIIST